MEDRRISEFLRQLGLIAEMQHIVNTFAGAIQRMNPEGVEGELPVTNLLALAGPLAELERFASRSEFASTVERGDTAERILDDMLAAEPEATERMLLLLKTVAHTVEAAKALHGADNGPRVYEMAASCIVTVLPRLVREIADFDM